MVKFGGRPLWKAPYSAAFTYNSADKAFSKYIRGFSVLVPRQKNANNTRFKDFYRKKWEQYGMGACVITLCCIYWFSKGD